MLEFSKIKLYKYKKSCEIIFFRLARDTFFESISGVNLVEDVFKYNIIYVILFILIKYGMMKWY